MCFKVLRFTLNALKAVKCSVPGATAESHEPEGVGVALPVLEEPGQCSRVKSMLKVKFKVNGRHETEPVGVEGLWVGVVLGAVVDGVDGRLDDHAALDQDAADLDVVLAGAVEPVVVLEGGILSTPEARLM